MCYIYPELFPPPTQLSSPWQPQTCPGLEQYSIKKFAEALEAMPRALAENTGVKVHTHFWPRPHSPPVSQSACTIVYSDSARGAPPLPCPAPPPGHRAGEQAVCSASERREERWVRRGGGGGGGERRRSCRHPGPLPVQVLGAQAGLRRSHHGAQRGSGDCHVTANCPCVMRTLWQPQLVTPPQIIMAKAAGGPKPPKPMADADD